MPYNKQQEKTSMPELNADIRAHCFDEVATGYTEEMAVNEAQRCLGCKNMPCMDGCPVNVKIPAFINKIADGAYEEAYKLIRSTNTLPAICGRVCPQERQCEAKCVRGRNGEPVAIGRLERFAADCHMKLAVEETSPPVSHNGHKVAIVGSGPAGLTCAGDLAANGFDVTVFEALHTLGGVLVYGIPEFRLPKEVVRREIESLRKLGVKFETNTVIGKTLTVDELFEDGFAAVFVGSGAGLPMFPGIPGEGLVGVMAANEFLTRINLMKAYLDEYATPIPRANTVAVIGGGNVAMDAARCARRLGAKNVYIVYRRSKAEMPARLEEIHHAEAEGIQFLLLTAPTEIIGDENGRVTALDCIRMELGEPDATGRRRPVELPDSRFSLPVDMVIAAIGNSPNPLIRNTTAGIETDSRGRLVIDEATMLTTREGVYAGGDAVTGAATVILAMGAGKRVAEEITKYFVK